MLSNNDFTVFGFKYESGIEAIKICNKKGFIIVLPFYGQIIWDAEFGKHSLKMKNMFSEPKFGNSIVDPYGCFAFHSGLIRNGCPLLEHDHDFERDNLKMIMFYMERCPVQLLIMPG